MINSTAGSLAKVFGLKPTVRVLSPFVGGGFGGKGLWSHQVLAAAAAKLAGRPVRLMLTREGVFRLVGGRTPTEQRVALGARRDGTLDALIHTGVAAMTTHNNCPEQFTFPARHLYAARTIRLAQKVADMDMLANTFMRAPGESVGTFALECAIDELAHDMRSTRSSCAGAGEPENDPTTRRRISVAQPVEGLSRRRGALRLGQARCDAGQPARRRMAYRHGRRDRDLSLLPHAGRQGAAAPRRRRPRHGVDGEPRDGHGHRHRAGAARRRPARLAARARAFEYGDTLPAGTMAGGSSQTAAPGGGDGGGRDAARASC